MCTTCTTRKNIYDVCTYEVINIICTISKNVYDMCMYKVINIICTISRDIYEVSRYRFLMSTHNDEFVVLTTANIIPFISLSLSTSR